MSEPLPDPGESNKQEQSDQHERSISLSFQGPLPPASELQKYEQTLSGTAERIVRMAEEEQKHRHSLNDRQASMESEDRRVLRIQIKRGQWFGFLIAVIALTVGPLTVIYSDTWIGTGFGGLMGVGGLASVIYAFTATHKDESNQ